MCEQCNTLRGRVEDLARRIADGKPVVPGDARTVIRLWNLTLSKARIIRALESATRHSAN